MDILEGPVFSLPEVGSPTREFVGGTDGRAGLSGSGGLTHAADAFPGLL